MVASEDKKTRNKIIVMVAALLAVAATILFLIMYIFARNRDSNSIGFNGGEYIMTVENGNHDPTIWSILFDNESKTFTETVKAGSIDSVLDQGTFTYDETQNKIYKRGKNGTEETLIVYGQYLIVDNYLFEGSSISGDKLNGTYSYKNNDGITYSAVFRDDGTFSYNSDMMIPVQGTYKVQNGVIKMQPDNGTTLVDFLIYNNSKLSNSYYVKNE